MTNRLRGLVNCGSRRTVGGATDQDKATIAIAAFDITFFVDLEPDTRMAECGGDIPGPVAGNARCGHTDCFGRIKQVLRFATRMRLV